MDYIARRCRENFGDLNNRVDNCVSGSWTQFSCVNDDDRIIRFQAVYWNCASGSLQIRDAYGNVIYSTDTTTQMTEPEVLNSFITVRLPLEYYASATGSSIRIWGEFV